MFEKIKILLFGCEGCEEELYLAQEYTEEGYHIATSNDRNFIEDKHICLMMCNDEGKIKMW